MLDSLIVLDTLVKVDERSYSAWLNNGFGKITAGEGPNGIHRMPLCEHKELDFVIQFAPAEISTKKAGHLSEVRHNVHPKMPGIRLGVR